METRFCVALALCVLFVSISGSQGKESRKSKKPKLNESNTSQKITVYKIADESDLPTDFKEQPHKYELTPVGILQGEEGDPNSGKALCIIARRKRSLFVDQYTKENTEKTEILKISAGKKRTGRARQNNGNRNQEPFKFRKYVARDQRNNNGAQNYVQRRRPEDSQNKNSVRFGNWYWPWYSTSPTSSSYTYPWSSYSYYSTPPSLRPSVISGSGPLVIQQSPPIFASSNGANCIITKAIQLDALDAQVLATARQQRQLKSKN